MRYTSKLMQEILRSPEARKIVDFISPIYSESYVGLWLLQVIGAELDDLQKWSAETAWQIVPQTCTWTLGEWEKEYGLLTNTSMPLENRRKNLLAQIRTRAPINPYKLQQIPEAITGVDARIQENVAANTFAIYLAAVPSAQIDVNTLRQAVDRAKPSHLIYEVQFEQGIQSDLYWGGFRQYAKKFSLKQIN